MEKQMNEIQTKECEQESLFESIPQEYLEKLNPAKTRFIMLYLTGMYTDSQIAKLIGVSQNTIGIWKYQPAVQAVIKTLQEREYNIIDSKLKSMRNKALDTLDGLLESPDDRVKYSATKDILDRTGHKAAQSIKVDKTVTTIEQQLKNLAEFSIDDDEVIDIDDYIEEIKNE